MGYVLDLFKKAKIPDWANRRKRAEYFLHGFCTDDLFDLAHTSIAQFGDFKKKVKQGFLIQTKKTKIDLIECCVSHVMMWQFIVAAIEGQDGDLVRRAVMRYAELWPEKEDETEGLWGIAVEVKPVDYYTHEANVWAGKLDKELERRLEKIATKSRLMAFFEVAKDCDKHDLVMMAIRKWRSKGWPMPESMLDYEELTADKPVKRKTKGSDLDVARSTYEEPIRKIRI